MFEQTASVCTHTHVSVLPGWAPHRWPQPVWCVWELFDLSCCPVLHFLPAPKSQLQGSRRSSSYYSEDNMNYNDPLTHTYLPGTRWQLPCTQVLPCRCGTCAYLCAGTSSSSPQGRWPLPWMIGTAWWPSFSLLWLTSCSGHNAHQSYQKQRNAWWNQTVRHVENIHTDMFTVSHISLFSEYQIHVIWIIYVWMK